MVSSSCLIVFTSSNMVFTYSNINHTKCQEFFTSNSKKLICALVVQHNITPCNWCSSISYRKSYIFPRSAIYIFDSPFICKVFTYLIDSSIVLYLLSSLVAHFHPICIVQPQQRVVLFMLMGAPPNGSIKVFHRSRNRRTST